MHELPCSLSQAKRLGKAMVAGPLGKADEELLDAIQGAYLEAQDEVTERLERRGVDVASGRIKQPGSLTDKLKRRPELQLPSVHDIAGVRHVMRAELGLDAQDQAASQVIEEFAAESRSPKLIDRRGQGKSSHGYRAVHVVVWCGKLPVEVQIRTHRQHRWAELNEAFGEVFGRQIRYGEPPRDPPTLPGVGPNLALVLDQFSTVVRRQEEIGEILLRLRQLPIGAAFLVYVSQPSMLIEVPKVRRRYAQIEREVDELMGKVMAILVAAAKGV